MLPPENGLVTFSFRAGDILSEVKKFGPGKETKAPHVTTNVKEACFTPLMSYITLELKVNEESFAAFKRENGEGYLDENGNLLYAYPAYEVFRDYILSLELVNGKGEILFPDSSGNNGIGDQWAEFIYPCLEEMPEELYLAPISEGKADMTFAIKIK